MNLSVKILALDYGTKRIGFAVGDLENRIATPVEVLQNSGEDFILKEISKFCLDWEIGIVVVGWPLNMEKGQKNDEILGKVRVFTEKLKDFLGKTIKERQIVVDFMDERLSSFEAEKLISELGENKKSHMDKDSLAAQVILQRYFEQS